MRIVFLKNNTESNILNELEYRETGKLNSQTETAKIWMLGTEDLNQGSDRMNGWGINDWETLNRQNKQDFNLFFFFF